MDTYLEHHGILGQKWGVRRYQNEDGTYTSAGKVRRREGYDQLDEKVGRSNRIQIDKKKLITGAATAATIAAATAYAINNPEAVTNAAKKAGKYLGKKAALAGEKMVDAAIASMGAIAVSKLAKELGEKEGMSEEEKIVNKILLDVGTAGISSLSSKNTSNKNGSTNQELLKKTRDLSSKVGNPKGMHGAEDEKAYQNLFRKNPDDDQKALIKAMRKNGYSPDQIEQYVFHSGIQGVFVITRDPRFIRGFL